MLLVRAPKGWENRKKEERKILGKVVILGDSTTGKTSFVAKIMQRRFIKDYEHSSNTICSLSDCKIGQKTLRIVYWDEPIGGILTKWPDSYIDTNVYFILFDITNRSSFEWAKQWKADFQYMGSDVLVFLVGNKIDRNNERVVTYEEGKTYADREQMLYVEISTKTGQGCKDLNIAAWWKIAKENKLI